MGWQSGEVDRTLCRSPAFPDLEPTVPLAQHLLLAIYYLLQKYRDNGLLEIPSDTDLWHMLQAEKPVGLNGFVGVVA